MNHFYRIFILSGIIYLLLTATLIFWANFLGSQFDLQGPDFAAQDMQNAIKEFDFKQFISDKQSLELVAIMTIAAPLNILYSLNHQIMHPVTTLDNQKYLVWYDFVPLFLYIFLPVIWIVYSVWLYRSYRKRESKSRVGLLFGLFFPTFIFLIGIAFTTIFSFLSLSASLSNMFM